MAHNTIKVAGRTVTTRDVLETIAEANRLGVVRFLRSHGYRESSRFHLRHDGRSYPSKAILGVAARLKPSEFFGGAAGAAASLVRLGFNVRNSVTGALMSRELDSLRRACEKQGLAVGEEPWPQTDVVPSAYFASGSNRPDEIRALSAAGADIGVAAPHVSKTAEAELAELAGSDVQVFIDSGAFSEVKWNVSEGRFDLVQTITPTKWVKILSLYRRLAVDLGNQLWIVAPDMVGNQDMTLERLRRYREFLGDLANLGARVLVPIQKGRLSQAEFAAQVEAVLAGIKWIPALPCKKAATTADEARSFASLWPSKHVHLLGLGIRNKQLASYLDAFQDRSVSLDSCWLAQNSGRTNGPNKGPRRLTRARDMAVDVLRKLGSSRTSTELAVYACLAAGLVR